MLAVCGNYAVCVRFSAAACSRRRRAARRRGRPAWVQRPARLDWRLPAGGATGPAERPNPLGQFAAFVEERAELSDIGFIAARRIAGEKLGPSGPSSSPENRTWIVLDKDPRCSQVDHAFPSSQAKIYMKTRRPHPTGVQRSSTTPESWPRVRARSPADRRRTDQAGACWRLSQVCNQERAQPSVAAP